MTAPLHQVPNHSSPPSRRGARAQRLHASVLAFFVVCAGSLSAVAQPENDPTSKVALAEALFEQGQAKLEAGQVAQACKLLEASNATDPALGTSLLLAHCYERQERTASAWALFKEVASLAEKSGDVDRAHIARVRAADLDSRLSRVTIDVEPTPASTVTVTLDDTTVPSASFGLAVPVDPGKRVLRATAEGHVPYEHIIEIAPGPAAQRIRIPALKPIPPSPTVNSPSVSKDVPAERESKSVSDLVWVSGGLGVLAVGASATFVILAKGDYDESLGNCRTETLCSPRGLELRGAAEKKANWATVSGAVGVGLLGASLGLWLFDDDDEEAAVPGGKVSLGATPDGANVTLEHRF